MTESKEPAERSEAEEHTALIVLSSGAINDRELFFEALDSLGFHRGPVVGEVCAVTGPRDQVVALCDHASIMSLDVPVAGASEELLALMRPAIKDIVFEEQVETFDEQPHDDTNENGETNDSDHGEPLDEGMG